MYKTFGSEQLDRIKEIYSKMGWTSYLGADDVLAWAFGQSLDVLGVFDRNFLVGIIRCVGDGGYILLIQDLIIAKAYQKQGLGSKLFKAI